MRTLITGLALALFTSAALAQVPGLSNAEVEDATSFSNPAKAVQKTGSGWVAMELPAIEGTHSPCCWQGNWSSKREIGCNLDKDHHSYGSTSESPLEDSIIVYARAEKGQVDKLRIMGAQCPVDAGGQQLTWIGETDDDDTLEWLQSLAGSKPERVAHASLWAIALHASNKAGDHLYSLAREADRKLAGEAIFWLGEARGQDGYEKLEGLLDELPTGKTRRQINFALSQNSSEQAVELLSDIARNDKDEKQRGDALFWLAEEQPELAEELIVEIIETERDKEVLEKAVFAMSQLPAETSGPALLALAQDKNAPREARRQALFWLSHSDHEESVTALTELLTK